MNTAAPRRHRVDGHRRDLDTGPGEAIDNFAAAVFLTHRTTTLPVQARSYIRDFDDPTVAAMAALLVGLSVVLVTAVDKVVGLDRFLELR